MACEKVTGEGVGTLSVLVVADPGHPSRRLRRIHDELQRALSRNCGQPVRLYVETAALRIMPDDTLDFSEARHLARTIECLDAVVLLTEIPRSTNRRPLVAEVFHDDGLAVVSYPTFGFAIAHRLHEVVSDCVRQLSSGQQFADENAESSWSSWRCGEKNPTLQTSLVGGGLRTVCGMVISNEPVRTMPKLSGALAAASAAGAFGVFYNSVWQMSLALSYPRLSLITVLSVVAMVGWLITSNRLWDKPATRSMSAVVLLYNASTVMTLFCCVLVLYTALFIIILLSGTIVIAPKFLAQTVGHPHATFDMYLQIAWLSASMGVVAGGLGASFDSSTDLRQLTHGQRERQRWTSASTQDETDHKKE